MPNGCRRARRGAKTGLRHRNGLFSVIEKLATRHFRKQASGGILSPSKEPPRAPFDKLKVLATAQNTATFRNCRVARLRRSLF